MQKQTSITNILVAILLIAGLAAIVVVIASSANKTTTKATSTATSSSSSQNIISSNSLTSMTYQYNPDLKSTAAKIVTDKGEINLTLFPEVAPQTVSNFIRLAQSGFYNGLTFHRFEPGFVIQGGDPIGNGSGGPGYTVPAEISPKVKHVKGALATARTSDAVNPTKASSGSQFYITLEATPFLDNEYTVFGVVADGKSMEVVSSLRAQDIIMTIEISN